MECDIAVGIKHTLLNEFKMKIVDIDNDGMLQQNVYTQMVLIKSKRLSVLVANKLIKEEFNKNI